MNDKKSNFFDDFANEITTKIKADITDYQQAIAVKADPLADLINLDEAAAILKMSKYTIYGYTCRKAIPFHKAGKKLFFSKTELADWIKHPEKYKP